MSEWKKFPLGELLIRKPEYGANAPAIEYDGVNPRYLRITDIDDSGRLLETGKAGIASEKAMGALLSDGDIVIARTGNTVGKSYLHHSSNGSLVFAGYLIKFDTKRDKLLPGFLFQILHSSAYFKWIKATLHTGAQPNINAQEYCSLGIPHPVDTTEQRKIARILSTVDTVIERTELTIAKYSAIKQGMMHDLFTRGIDLKTGKLRPKYEAAPEMYKKTELGWVPKEWEIIAIDGICAMKSGEGITSKSITDYGQFPVYGGNGLRGYTSTYTHDGDYVLIGRQGALCGNVNRVSNKFYASEHAVVVTVFHDISVDWLSLVLWSMNLNQYSEASAQPGLAVSKILKLIIKKPPFKEQKIIAKYLLSLDSKVILETQFLKKKQEIKTALMSVLLTGRKRVKVDFAENKVAAL